MRCAHHLLLPLLAAVAAAQQTSIVALRGLDPVELCNGTEVEGVAEIGAVHGAFKYRFTTEANRRTFAADPERYAIQWGGACARMGPLSGRGDPDRFVVHDGRIYIFASDACRDAFVQQPDHFLPRREPALDADAAARTAGAALLARAIAGIGGEAALHFETLRLERRSMTKTDNGERLDTHVLVYSRSNVRVDETYGDHHYSTLLLPHGGCFVGNDGVVEPMHAIAERELQLQIAREPLLLLAQAREPGVELAAAGKAVTATDDVELLQIQRDGARTTIGIDREGRIVLVRYRGRGPQLWFGDVEWTWSDFRKVGAALLPFHGELRFDGKAEPQSARQLHAISIDAELPVDFFAPRRH